MSAILVSITSPPKNNPAISWTGAGQCDEQGAVELIDALLAALAKARDDDRGARS